MIGSESQKRKALYCFFIHKKSFCWIWTLNSSCLKSVEIKSNNSVSVIHKLPSFSNITHPFFHLVKIVPPIQFCHIFLDVDSSQRPIHYSRYSHSHFQTVGYLQGLAKCFRIIRYASVFDMIANLDLLTLLLTQMLRHKILKERMHWCLLAQSEVDFVFRVWTGVLRSSCLFLVL